MLKSPDEVREFRRVVASFPHFLASYVHLADGGDTKLEPWPWQLRLAQVWREQRQVVMLKARQLGVSWMAAAYALWTALTEKGALVLLASQTEADAVELLAKVQFIFDHLPPFQRCWRRCVGNNADTYTHTVDFGTAREPLGTTSCCGSSPPVV